MVLNLTHSGASIDDITKILAEEWGKHSLKRTAIYKWHARGVCGVAAAEKQKPSGKPSDVGIDDAIQNFLKKEPFASCRRLASELNLWVSTVHNHLTQSFGLVFKHTRYVSHKLGDDQKSERVNLAKGLIHRLGQHKHNSWRYIVTCDESWFYFSYSHNGKWLGPDDFNPIEESTKNSWLNFWLR